MRPKTFGVHFIVRNNRMDKEGYVPIYAKIIISSQILKISLNHRIKPLEWSTEKERPKVSSPSNDAINEALEAFKGRIYQAYSKVVASNEELTAENLKIAFYGKRKEVVSHTLIQVAEEHNKHFESMVGIKYSYGSYKNYKTTLKYLLEFVPIYFKKKDIPLEKVNYKFCEGYFSFVTTQKNCRVNGANKQLQRLKKIINYAIKQGYISTNPMSSFTLEFTPVNKIALTLIEIQKLQKLKLQRQTLNEVRDIFLLQCYTGLAYTDIKQLSVKNIQEVENGEYWIRMERQKTQISFSVPLLSPALSIINKYLDKAIPGQPLLPVLSNQKMNENLKVIQELASIDKNLTTHLARHTFATTLTLGNGVPIETVSRMLGHTKLSTTQVYAKVLDNKIAEDMKALKAKLEDKEKRG
jgi:site-specific recombinase XerD